MHVKRAFILNLIFLVGVNLLVKPLYLLGVDRGIQNAATPASYGIYFELFNFTFLFQMLSDLGIQYYNNRTIAQHPFLLKKYFPYFLGAKAVLGLLYFLVVLAFGVAAGYGAEHGQLLLILALVQLFSTLLSFIRSNISGLGLYYTDSLLSILDKLILIFLLGIPLWGGMFSNGFDIALLGYMQLLALCLSVVIGVSVLYVRFGWLGIKLNKHLNLVILKESMPYALAVLLMTLYTRVDAVLIGRMLPNGQEEVGYYAAAYRLLDAANMMGVLFAGLLLPMYARINKDRIGLGALAETGIRVLWSGVWIIAPVIVVFSDVVMNVLYTQVSEQSDLVLSLLILSFIPASGIYIFSTLLLATGHQRKVNWIYLSGAVLSVILNSLLIPSMAGLGSAIAVLVTQSFVFIGILIGCKEWEMVSIPRTLWIRFIALGGVVWFIGNMVKPVFDSVQDWRIAVIPLVVGMAGVLQFKLITISQMTALFHKRTALK